MNFVRIYRVTVFRDVLALLALGRDIRNHLRTTPLKLS